MPSVVQSAARCDPISHDDAPQSSVLPAISGYLANVRSLRQASGDIQRQVTVIDADIFFVTESHLKDDPTRCLIPSGYKVVGRFDRTKHGGGVIAGAKKHLLASKLDLSEYCIREEAEMAGFELDNVNYVGCYTSNSMTAKVLIAQCNRYLRDNLSCKVVFLGDFNVHNQEWIGSASPTDDAGIDAQHMCEAFGLHQLVDFPTRGANTLDLIMSHLLGQATAMANPGTSDHAAVAFEIHVLQAVQAAPVTGQVLDWEHAPWNHISGAIRRYLKDWDPWVFESVGHAQQNLDEWLTAIIDRYVRHSAPAVPGPAPWWNYHCEKAFKFKMKTFSTARDDPDRFFYAVRWNKMVQRVAYKRFNQKIRDKLSTMAMSDRNFWNTVKDISGLDAQRSNAAPSAEGLAD